LSDLQINKTYTSNPFVDYLLYYTKILAFGSVIKDDDEADRNETEASMMAGDILISCVEDSVIFELFSYSKEELLDVGITDPVLIRNCLRDRNFIPERYRPAITELAKNRYIENYEELNPYYRKICGLPPINDYGIPIRDYEYFFTNNENPWNVTFIHELPLDALLYLEQRGILDQIKKDYPDAAYLDYITYGITPYIARKAYDYQLLYYPKADGDIIQEKFVRKYNENRLYVMATFYSEGLKMTSKYYSNFIGMMIMLMTMIDILSELQEHIVKKDILDKRCIQFIFEMYGIPYYNSIPIKYQYRMCKNVNQLIRYKSCAQGMLNLIDLFGAENIEVFKYFILRDRNIDRWGDIIYDQVETTNIAKNDIITHDQYIKSGTYASGTIIDIPFPIDNYLESRNKMVIFANGRELAENIDYTINNESKLVLKKRLSNLRFDFYYYDPEKFNIDKENSLSVKSDDIDIITSRTFSFKLPYKSYLIDGNDLLVSLGGAILGKDQYTINRANNTITLDSSFDITKTNEKGRHVSLIYLFAKNIITKYKKVTVTATTANQTTFTIPEPFTNYTANDNIFFITYRNTFVQNNRYTVNKNNHTITFTDIKVPKNIDVVFYFVYAEASTYQDINIQRKDVTITVTEDYQTKFSLVNEDLTSMYPFENYLKTPYKVYVKVRNDIRMLDKDYYDVYSKTLLLRDSSLCLKTGETITVSFVYGPHETMNSLQFVSKQLIVSENYQSEFDIELPEDNFFSEYNGGVIIDIYGNYLEPSDYTINESTKKLTITNRDKLPAANEKMYFLFIRNIVTANNIESEQQYPTIGLKYNGKPRFNISLPFVNYFETGHGILVFHNSMLISPKRVHYATEKNGAVVTHFIYLDDTMSEYQAATDSVTVLFLYNGLYKRELEERIKTRIIEKSIEEIIDDDLIISIPYPYSNYLENGWFMYITDEDNNIVYRSDNDETGDDTTSNYPCEVINGALTFVDSSVIPTYDILKFNFIYFDSPKYLYQSYEEDYEKNYNLKFIGVPLSQEYHNLEIMEKINVLQYDPATIEDYFWDGIGYDTDRNELHNKVKLDILKKKFNYERTKYFGINYLINISEMAFRISYFYNMLYDKNLIENNLNIKVPSIAPYAKFNIAHLFCYMTSLAYLYAGVEDYILNNFSTILRIKGFNFNADLEALKEWLRDQFRYLDINSYSTFSDFPETGEIGMFYIDKLNKKIYHWDGNEYKITNSIDNISVYDVWDFITLDNLDSTVIGDEYISDGNGQIKDMESFIKIFNNNKSIYDKIVNTIYQSPDYDIYSIWKKFYDTLMTIEFSDKFYKVTLTQAGIDALGYEDDIHHTANGHSAGETIVARSFKELLYYRNIELYNDIVYIESIDDEIQRNDTIIERIADIVYLLEEYIDSDEFRNIYDMFPGVSGNSLLNYLFTIINFFKSYKIVLRSKGDFIIFTADDPMLNTIKIIDVKDTEVDLEKPDYLDIHETIESGVYLYKDDFIEVKDKMSMIPKITSGIPSRFLPLPSDYPYKTTTTSKITIKKTLNQTIKVYTTTDLVKTSSASSNVVFNVEYGTEFYAFISASSGWNPGILNIKYGKVFDDDIVIEATDATTIMKELNIYQTPNQTITVYRTGESTTKSKVVPYGISYNVKIEADEGYKPGTIEIYPEEVITGDNKFEVTDNVSVSASEATLRTYSVIIVAPSHEAIALNIKGIVEFVQAGKTKELTDIEYNTPYSLSVYSDEGYNPGTLNIPATGKFDKNVEVGTTGVVRITATAATVIKYKVKLEQTLHQTIKVHYNGSTYSGNGSINVTPNTHITCSIISEDGYIAGVLNITDHYVNEDITISATPAIEAENLLITIDHKNNQVITVICNGESFTSDTYVPFGSSYTSYITANPGYTTTAEIINGSSDELRNNIVVYASKDATPNINTITIINPDPVHQTVLVYVNQDQAEEDAKTETFTLKSGNTISAEIISIDTGYIAGNLNIDGSIMVTEDINIIATAPTRIPSVM